MTEALHPPNQKNMTEVLHPPNQKGTKNMSTVFMTRNSLEGPERPLDHVHDIRDRSGSRTPSACQTAQAFKAKP